LTKGELYEKTGERFTETYFKKRGQGAKKKKGGALVGQARG